MKLASDYAEHLDVDDVRGGVLRVLIKTAPYSLAALRASDTSKSELASMISIRPRAANLV